LTTIQEKAQEAAQWFESASRENGDSFIRTKDGTPEWVTELIHAAHHGFTDFLPDDYRYQWTFEALEFIAESDDPEDGQSEFADNAVSVYTPARLQWLASNLQRPGYCDEAANEFGYDGKEGIVGLIGIGQYAEASEVYGLALQALEA